jgi:hypothetical protein
MNMPTDAFLTTLYVIVDDWYQLHGPRLLAGKAGAKPRFSDSEVLTLSLAQQRVLIALEAGPDGSLRRVHPHGPSWQNWPLLEHAVMDNIVPDFPLINKSFNLSYSGQDL